MVKKEEIVSQILNIFERYPDIQRRVNGGVILKSLGRMNPKSISYLIRRSETQGGLFSNFFTTLSHVIYSSSRGWDPVVDMRSRYFVTLHESPGDVGRVNCWEDYFYQPSSVELDDAERGANVVVALDTWAEGNEIEFSEINSGSGYYRVLKRYFDTLKISRDVTDMYEKVRGKYSPFLDSALGVSYRSEYDLIKPRGHFVQPTLTELMSIADDALRSYGFTKIFVATEDFDAIEAFKCRYGSDRVIFTERPRLNDHASPQASVGEIDDSIVRITLQGLSTATSFPVEPTINQTSFGREREKYCRNMDYLIEHLILAECGGIVGARTNGVMFSLLNSRDGYRFEYLPTARYA